MRTVRNLRIKQKGKVGRKVKLGERKSWEKKRVG